MPEIAGATGAADAERRFEDLQKRRSQTEARVAIFKNGFLGGRLLSQGHSNQKGQVAWAVLTHNLWLVARQKRQERSRMIGAAA